MWNLSLLVEGSKLTTLSFPRDSMCKKKKKQKKTHNVFHCSDLPNLFSILGITDFSDFFIHSLRYEYLTFLKEIYSFYTKYIFIL